MRLKIIAGNLIVVLIVGLTAWWVVRSQLSEGLTQRVDDRIDNDRQLFERSWRMSGLEFVGNVQNRANQNGARNVFHALDEQGRRSRAHETSNTIAAWLGDPARGTNGMPEIVAILDETGKVIARNADPNNLFGRQLVSEIPALRTVISDVTAKLDVWNRTDENKLLQVGMSPILNDARTMVGVLLVGYDISSGRASSESQVLGHEVAFVAGDKIYSSSLESGAAQALQSVLFGAQEAGTQTALAGGTGGVFDIKLGEIEYTAVSARLPDTPSVPAAYVVLANRTDASSLVDVTNFILILTALGAFAILIYGFILAGTFLKPLEQIEEDVLSVINGRRDLRINVKSAEFGGLAYRINQLINVFTGQSDDGTGGTWGDAAQSLGGMGRPSAADAPSAAKPANNEEAVLAAKLAAEDGGAYQERVFAEYIAAKQAAGEDVSNITKDKFLGRLDKNAQKLATQHGCRMVRFHVMSRSGQVILKPVIIR